MRRALLLCSLLAVSSATAAAQSPPADEQAINDSIAASLVERAQELFDVKEYVDAKQLASEALMRSPRGPSAAKAQMLIKACNTALGIGEPKPPDKPVDTTPITDPLKDKPVVVQPEPALGTVAPKWRRIASGAAWGTAAGGLFADAVGVGTTKPWHVIVGAGAGGVLGGLAAYGLTRKVEHTKGDVALMDTLAGIGGAGGLTVGMLMQPVESEAYSVNAIIGVGAGLLVGYIAAPQTNTTERRMLRVAGISLAGGALPFLLYAGIYDKSTDSDERLVGGLATAGLLAGAYIGFRLTRNMDEGKDELPGKGPTEEAPVALRIGLTPLAMTPDQGMAVSLVGGAF
jgi:uncharacterized protein YcfJ